VIIFPFWTDTNVFFLYVAAQEIAELESQGKLTEEQHPPEEEHKPSTPPPPSPPPASKPAVPHLAPSSINTTSNEWTSPFIQQSFVPSK
jgi:hypothetical protein